jgi:hypothetical protein
MSLEKFAKLDARLVGVLQLWGIVGAGSQHTFEDVINMAGDEFREKQPLLFTHKNVHYMVPFEELKKYFAEHPVPEKLMTTKDEQIAMLEQKLKTLEKEREIK